MYQEKVTLKTQLKHAVVHAAAVHAAMYRMKRYAVYVYIYSELSTSVDFKLLMLGLQIDKEV